MSFLRSGWEGSADGILDEWEGLMGLIGRCQSVGRRSIKDVTTYWCIQGITSCLVGVGCDREELKKMRKGCLNISVYIRILWGGEGLRM
jgi:hypothetical protein